MIRIPLALTVTLLLSGAAVTSDLLAVDVTGKEATAATALNEKDAKFVHNALLGGMLEIKTSELAIKRGATGEDRTFAQKMIDDHTKVNDELQAIAKDKGITVPTMLDEKAQKKVDALAKEDDKKFPEAYADCQVDAHKEAVSDFTKASEDAKDVDVKAFAAKHLPHLQMHLEQAKALAKKY